MSDLDERIEVLRPEASRFPLRCLPFEYRQFICDIIDSQGSDGYHIFGEKLGLLPYEVQALKNNNNGRSVTEAILNKIQHNKTIWDLILVLHQMKTIPVNELLMIWHGTRDSYQVDVCRLGVQHVESVCGCVNCYPQLYHQEWRSPVSPCYSARCGQPDFERGIQNDKAETQNLLPTNITHQATCSENHEGSDLEEDSPGADVPIDWHPPDSISIQSRESINGVFEIFQDHPHHEASVVYTGSPKPMAGSIRPHGNTRSSLPKAHENGKNVMVPEIEATAAVKAGYPRCNNGKVNTTFSHGYPDTPLDQTMRKAPYSTTEAYRYLRQYVHQDVPAPCCQSCPNDQQRSYHIEEYHPNGIAQGGCAEQFLPQIHSRCQHVEIAHNNRPLDQEQEMARNVEGPMMKPDDEPPIHRDVRPKERSVSAVRDQQSHVTVRREIKARNQEKRHSDPPTPEPHLGQCLSRSSSCQDGLSSVYGEEDAADVQPKYVFITGGDHRSQEVERNMWELCKVFYKNNIHVVADLPRGLVVMPGDPLQYRRRQRENINESIHEFFHHATRVVLAVSPGYKNYVDGDNGPPQPSPTDHQVSTRFIYTEMLHEHCFRNFSKNKRFYPVKLRKMNTENSDIPDWISSTLIYTFPSNRRELISHLQDDLGMNVA